MATLTSAMSPDTEEQPIESEPDFVQAWLDAIEAASDEEKEWREEAKEAVDAYRGKDEASKAFNLYHANIETIVPALYNSVPAPDVRRRFLDPNPAAKVVADIIERALSYSVDSYDFDASMNSSVRDMAIVGRGVQRVRYEITEDDDGNIADEQTVCEYVPWRSFRHGPGRLWSDVTWVAFEHFLDRATIEARVAPEVAQEIPYKHSASAKDAEKDEQGNSKGPPRFGKRAHVWEVWDKDKREVHFISPDYGDKRLWTVPDPLNLQDFFPIPRPMQAVTTTDSLVPVASYSLYKSLLGELNDVSRRIKKLVKQLRPRGMYAGTSLDMTAWTEADDGELVPMSGLEAAVAQGGAIEKAIAWFPLEPTIVALRELVQHREMIKQNIYEVTKIADVMRGVSKPNETLGAQNLKAEWGSLAIQKMQGEVARFARDLFRMKAEVMVDKMDFGHLLAITGITLPAEQEKQAKIAEYQAAQQQASQPQPEGAPPVAPPPEPSPQEMAYWTGPSLEDVQELLTSDKLRGYHVDIESDSTIRADLGRRQEHLRSFLEAVSGFGSSIGPMVESGHMPAEVAVEIFAAIARNAKLGKQAEDALDQWADSTKNKGQQQQGDPAQAQAQAEQQAEQAKIQADMEMKGQELQARQAETQARMQSEQAKMQTDAQIKAQELQSGQQVKLAEVQARTQEAQARLEFEREQAAAKLQFEREEALARREAERATRQADQTFRGAELRLKEREVDIKERELALKGLGQDQKFIGDTMKQASQDNAMQMKAKADAAKPKPSNGAPK